MGDGVYLWLKVLGPIKPGGAAKETLAEHEARTPQYGLVESRESLKGWRELARKAVKERGVQIPADRRQV